MAVKLYNTFTRAKEEFVPVRSPEVTFYVCGPTVYDYIHMGNARVFIIADVIRRYLDFRGYRVKMVQNYTDIDDKMIDRARDEGVPVEELAERYIEAYRADAALLSIAPADIHPLATGHINQIIDLIKRLINRGFAYAVDGDVYFDTGRFSRYGMLSQQKTGELVAGARVDPGEKKNDPLDFVLWKRRKPGEPSWESPWGSGRPGWHIECSAMAMHYLGDTVDIHAGGADLVFPHHENEIAQSSAATGAPFVRYWLHAGYLNIEEKKMSKSLGNMLTVRRLLEEHDPLDLRFLILSAHYRSPLNFSDALVGQARAGRERLQETVDNLLIAQDRAGHNRASLEERVEAVLEDFRRKFIESMDDDFNTAGGIAVLFELARESNIYLREGHPYAKEMIERLLSFYREVNEILHILDFEKRRSPDEEIIKAIAERDRARRQKDWQAADRIRDELLAGGIVLEDTPHGTRWKRR